MNTREVANQYRLNKWTEIVRECRSSGQTISSWCADQQKYLKKILTDNLQPNYESYRKLVQKLLFRQGSNKFT